MMPYATHNPAVFAGLTGAFAVPVSGMAAVALSGSGSLQGPFVLGCMSGIVIMCGVSLGVVVHERRARELDDLYAGAHAVGAHMAAHAGGTHGAHAASRVRGRHMGAAEWEKTGTIRVRPPAEPSAQDAARLDDYVAVAERYVGRERAVGALTSVREALVERLGASLTGSLPSLTGSLPVIPHAEGPFAVADDAPGSTASFEGSPTDQSAAETGDLGRARPARRTPRHMAPASAVAGTSVPVSAPADPSAPVATAAADPSATVAAAGGAWSLPEPAPDRVAQAQRAAAIGRRVARLELGAFPERRAAAEPGLGDTFSRALVAMDERLAGGAPAPLPVFEPAPAFQDAVGDVDTLDEPLGLEPSTDFLSFRVPAGHPEVVDEATYVDYLIGEEFAANPSSTARRSSRDFLRVIQGGQESREERYAQAL